MTDELDAFIQKARDKKLDDTVIKRRLVAEGWDEAQVNSALAGETDDLVVPKPPQTLQTPVPTHVAATDPVPVVQNLSTRGFEYSIMFASLWAAAFSLGVMAHNFVNNVFPKVESYYSSGDDGNAFFATVLLVFAPVFAFMFLRLKKAELTTPGLRKDPSRRKLSHLTQFVSFLVGMGYVVYFVYSLVQGDSYGGAQSFAELSVHLLVTLVIAGSIFAYYWIDEHRANHE